MNTTMMGVMGTVQLICTIWVLYEVWAVNKSLSTGAKVLWTLAAIFFGFISAIAYYFFEKSRKEVQTV